MRVALTIRNEEYLNGLRRKFRFDSYEPTGKRVFSALVRMGQEYGGAIKEWNLEESFRAGDKTYKLTGTAKEVAENIIISLSAEAQDRQSISIVVNRIIDHIRTHVSEEVTREALKDYLRYKDFSFEKNDQQLCLDLPKDLVTQLNAAAQRKRLALGDYLVSLLKKGFSGSPTQKAKAKLSDARELVSQMDLVFADTAQFIVLNVGSEIRSTLEDAANDDLEALLRDYLYLQSRAEAA